MQKIVLCNLFAGLGTPGEDLVEVKAYSNDFLGENISCDNYEGTYWKKSANYNNPRLALTE